MSSTFLGLPWAFWAVVCLAIAVIYTALWPKQGPRGAVRPAWRHLVLRWFHSLVWLFLALSCLVRAVGNSALLPLADPLALLGLATYLTFTGTLWLDRRALHP